MRFRPLCADYPTRALAAGGREEDSAFSYIPPPPRKSIRKCRRPGFVIERASEEKDGIFGRFQSVSAAGSAPDTDADGERLSCAGVGACQRFEEPDGGNFNFIPSPVSVSQQVTEE